MVCGLWSFTSTAIAEIAGNAASEIAGNAVPSGRVLALEIVFHFQEQSYSSLHSGQSLIWIHFCGIIVDPCRLQHYRKSLQGCGIIADPC